MQQVGALEYGLGADEEVCTNMSCYVHLHMSLSSSAAPVADIETYSGMCGRCEEAGGR